MADAKSYWAFEKIPAPVRYPLRYAHLEHLCAHIQGRARGAAKPPVVLDIGCGPGTVAEFCSAGQNPADSARTDWVGIDLWPNQLAQAAEKNIYRRLIQTNLVEGLPLADDSVDVVVCGEVLMYLPDPAATLAEFRRVTRPGGELIIHNPICLTPRFFTWLKRLTGSIYKDKRAIRFIDRADWRRAERPSRITYYSYSGLIDSVKRAGFELEQAVGFRVIRSRIRLLGRLENQRWYYRATLGLAAKLPRLVSDLTVIGRRPTSQ